MTDKELITTLIREISREEVIRCVNEQILTYLKNKWKDEFREAKARWNERPGWQALNVGMYFKLNGQECSLHPPDLGLEVDSWDQAFMENISYYIEKDLKLFGVTDFHKTGRMD
jgi:hypothetical protein